MPDLNASRTNHKSILSSLTALGASELPVATNSVPRNSVLASVAAAGVSLLACQSADAGTISVFTPNVNVGFAAGDINNFELNIASLIHSGFGLETQNGGGVHELSFHGVMMNRFFVHFRSVSGTLGAIGTYGQKFSQIGRGTKTPNIRLESRTAGAAGAGSDFSLEYYSFYFTDTSSQTHYGWVYGTLTGGYSNMSYNLISYAYDTTPSVEIGMGYTGVSGTPEPSTTVLGAMAALILGAAGVRKRNTAKA
jgi:hypothetical protein